MPLPRALLVMDGIALVAGAAGLTTLVRPAAPRALLGIEASEQATYALRIVGAMLFALALFLGGFATAFALAGGAA